MNYCDADKLLSEMKLQTTLGGVNGVRNVFVIKYGVKNNVHMCSQTTVKSQALGNVE